MRFARMEGGRAVEFFEAPDRDALEMHPDFVAALEDAPEDAEVGWTLADGEWSAPAAPEPPAPVLRPLSPVQFWTAALGLGIEEADVEAWIVANIEDEVEQKKALLKLRKAQEFERNDPLFLDVTNDLPVTVEQIDAAWLAVQGG